MDVVFVSAAVRPGIDIGLLLVILSFVLLVRFMFVVVVVDGSSSIGRMGMRGTLKKPNTSRYSSSFGAGFRVIGCFIMDGSVGIALLGIGKDEDDDEEDGDVRGCRDIKKSRSNAQRRISARILTEEGVLRSLSISADC